jgi:hypothetical protein
MPFLPLSYNKKEEDFVSLKEYNDYLEEIETISKYTWRIQVQKPINTILIKNGLFMACKTTIFDLSSTVAM